MRVVRIARRAQRDSVRGVVPTERPSCRRDCMLVWFRRTPVVPCGSVLGWCAYAEQANDGGQPAEPIVAADRCAREIVAFLTSSHAARLRPAELNRWATAINAIFRHSDICVLQLIAVVQHHLPTQPITGHHAHQS